MLNRGPTKNRRLRQKKGPVLSDEEEPGKPTDDVTKIAASNQSTKPAATANIRRPLSKLSFGDEEEQEVLALPLPS